MGGLGGNIRYWVKGCVSISCNKLWPGSYKVLCTSSMGDPKLWKCFLAIWWIWVCLFVPWDKELLEANKNQDHMGLEQMRQCSHFASVIFLELCLTCFEPEVYKHSSFTWAAYILANFRAIILHCFTSTGVSNFRSCNVEKALVFLSLHCLTLTYLWWWIVCLVLS